MKHCHFSILYNELPFLKQKLPFLYKHFDQIIFYDLNATTLEFSDDGSHEYIKNFADPENKITLIEKRNLEDVTEYNGLSMINKQKMFAVASPLVNDDIDVFWCTDMDEFFSPTLITAVESHYKNHVTGSIHLDQIIYFKNQNFVFCTSDGTETLPWGLSRITQHKKGNVYGHCNIQSKFPPAIRLKDHLLHHFSFVGTNRVKFKFNLYKTWGNRIRETYGYFNNFGRIKQRLLNGEIIPRVYHDKPWGAKKRQVPLLEWIDHKQLIKDLG